LKNSSVEITKMTLAGVKTSIEVESIDEVKNLLFLCEQKVILYKLVVNFVCIEEYEELKSLYFEFVKINHLQTKVINILNIRFDDIRRTIESIENCKVKLTFHCYDLLLDTNSSHLNSSEAAHEKPFSYLKNFNFKQPVPFSYLESSEFKDVVRRSSVFEVTIYTSVYKLFYNENGDIVKKGAGLIDAYKKHDLNYMLV